MENNNNTQGRFLETICVREGNLQHLEWHQRRVNATLSHFYPEHHHSWELHECIKIPFPYSEGLIRCRILYDVHHLSIHFHPYSPREIKTLKIVVAPSDFEYHYKYSDRKVLDQLYGLRESADDILITSQDGWILDTSVANIAFQKNGKWYSPFIPLLAGTSWKRLVAERILTPQPINRKDLMKFDTFKVFNVMNGFQMAIESPVSNIR